MFHLRENKPGPLFQKIGIFPSSEYELIPCPQTLESSLLGRERSVFRANRRQIECLQQKCKAHSSY